MQTRGAKRKVSKFSASATLETPVNHIKINGGKYEAFNTGDGYHVVKNIPILAEVPKGTNNAPYDVTKEELEKFLSSMQSRYSQGNRTGALSVGHNDDLGLTHPDFAGYFLPTKVEKFNFPKGEKWTLFADFKITNDKFADFAAGKLPMHSPEIYPQSWADHKVDLVCFLDTKPSHFEFPLNNVGKITEDGTAKFAAVYEDKVATKLLTDDLAKMFSDSTLKAIATRFAAYAEKTEETKTTTKIEKGDEEKVDDGKPEKKGEEKKPKGGEGEDKFASEYPEAHTRMAAIETNISKMAQHFGLTGMDNLNKKPDSKPVEPGETDKGGSKMSMDAETAAKFAAMANDNAEIKKKLAERERGEKIAAFMAKADSILSRKILSDRGIVSEFAAQAADKADGEKWFTEIVEKLKPSLRDKPPRDVAEFAAAGLPVVESTDPILSKFSAQGANPMDVSKFAAQWRQIKSKLGDNFTCTEESYITNELTLAKAAGQGERR